MCTSMVLLIFFLQNTLPTSRNCQEHKYVFPVDHHSSVWETGTAPLYEQLPSSPRTQPIDNSFNFFNMTLSCSKNNFTFSSSSRSFSTFTSSHTASRVCCYICITSAIDCERNLTVDCSVVCCGFCCCCTSLFVLLPSVLVLADADVTSDDGSAEHTMKTSVNSITANVTHIII